MEPRVSTAVLLTRGTASEVEVFLVERAPQLRFFGGYWALPGGVVEAADQDGGSSDSDEAHRRCAARELFEETGVWPASLELEASAAAKLRAALLAEDGQEDWRALLGLHPEALGAFRPFARLTTPPFAPLRYRTCFVHCALPAGQDPTVIPGELTQGRFWRPAEVLESWRQGGRFVVPPVLYLMEQLAAAGFGEAFFQRAARTCGEMEGGKLHPSRITPGAYTIPLLTPTLPPATTTNCSVVGEDLLYVIDPATQEPAEQERLFDFLDGLVAAGRKLEAVLATHHHADHVGAVNAVSARYRLPVRGHPLTLARLAPGFHAGPPIDDGDVLELGRAPDGSPGWRLQAFHTPGHDRGHLVFWESRYRSLIAGDLASTLSTIIIDPPEGHLATYLASLERIRALPLGVLYPAHGPPHRDGRELLHYYLKHRAAREQKLLAALSSGPAELEALLPQVYADVPAALHPYAARSLLAGLEKLEEEGRAQRHGRRWRAPAAGTFSKKPGSASSS